MLKVVKTNLIDQVVDIQTLLLEEIDNNKIRNFVHLNKQDNFHCFNIIVPVLFALDSLRTYKHIDILSINRYIAKHVEHQRAINVSIAELGSNWFENFDPTYNIKLYLQNNIQVARVKANWRNLELDWKEIELEIFQGRVKFIDFCIYSLRDWTLDLLSITTHEDLELKNTFFAGCIFKVPPSRVDLFFIKFLQYHWRFYGG